MIADAPMPSSPGWHGGRSVLMIACAFPPTSGSGVQRPAKFAKYLHRLGWRVRVWCGRELPRLPRDESLARDVPEGVAVNGLRAWNVPRVLAHCAYPDERIEWVVRSYAKLLRDVRRDRPDVIWSTFSPASNHLMGWALSRAAGLPWVADFRDLWTSDCAYVETSWWRKRLDARLERFFVRRADAVVAVSDAQRRILAAHAPDAPDKFFTITNGVDTEDLPAMSGGFHACPQPPELSDRKRDRCVIAHVGRLEAQRFTPQLVSGFERFARLHAAGARDIELRFVGQVNAGVVEALSRAGFNTHKTGHVDHAAALLATRQADVLLLPAAQGRNADSLIPGKTFEYLASGRPIWFIGPAACEAWQRIAPLSAGLRCDASAGDIADTLASLVAAWRHGVLPAGCRPEALTPYHRQTLASQLADTLIWAIHRRVTQRVLDRARRSPATSPDIRVARRSGARAAEPSLSGAAP